MSVSSIYAAGRPASGPIIPAAAARPPPPPCRCLTAFHLCLLSVPTGSTEDQRRIERQLKEREEQHKQYEEAKKKAAAGAGLRQFGAASSEVRGCPASLRAWAPSFCSSLDFLSSMCMVSRILLPA